MDHFARRGLIPSAVTTNQVGRTLDVVIEHPTMEEAMANLICESMTQILSVETVKVRSIHR